VVPSALRDNNVSLLKVKRVPASVSDTGYKYATCFVVKLAIINDGAWMTS